jgi:hypothetical protein
MRLVPKEWDHYNPVLIALGLGVVVVGGYGLMIPAPPIVWLVRRIPAIVAGVGSIILIRQMQLRRGRQACNKPCAYTALKKTQQVRTDKAALYRSTH